MPSPLLNSPSNVRWARHCPGPHKVNHIFHCSDNLGSPGEQPFLRFTFGLGFWPIYFSQIPSSHMAPPAPFPICLGFFPSDSTPILFSYHMYFLTTPPTLKSLSHIMIPFSSFLPPTHLNLGSPYERKMLHLSLWVYLISLSPLLVDVIASSFFMATCSSTVYICHIFCIHWGIGRHLCCFQFLAIMNSAAMKIDMPLSLWYVD